VIVPVGTAHVGCTVPATVGTEGAVGTASIVIAEPVDTQVVSLVSLTLTVYEPGTRFAKVVADCQVVPFILYSKVAPVGELTTIVPVGTAHVGCTVALATGAAGAPGTASIVTVEAAGVEQVLSAVLLTVKV
jgi:hypothetical protein